MAIVVGCSNDGGDSTSAVPASASASIGAESSSAVSSSGSADSAGSPESSDVAGPPSTMAVIAETGVPGLDSEDAFCRAWSEFAGSFQALALASSFATDPLRAARAELAAAPVLLAAVDGLAAHLPPELEAERAALTVELVSPMARRAESAIEELQSAGLDRGQIDELGAAWLVALAAAGLDDPDIAVTVDADLAGPLDEAASSFGVSVPPITSDPSLITDASTPLTFEYLSANCPDQGTLGGIDVVVTDQP